jgi:(2R)-sulfolactate sulfo-lyase subunit alpha
LVHHHGDHVGVAVVDIPAGQEAVGVYLDDGGTVGVRTTAAVPLGHKVALTELGKGEDVLKYGIKIGVTKDAIGAGDYVHTHNVRSARW